jgi:hypothetical protein
VPELTSEFGNEMVPTPPFLTNRREISRPPTIVLMRTRC